MSKQLDRKVRRLVGRRSTSGYLGDAVRYVGVLLGVATVGLLAVCLPAQAQSLDVDGNGAVDVATDIVYIARHLLDLPPVPADFRILDPGIPPDTAINSNIDGLGTALDVDANGVVDVATDIVYIARFLLGLAPVPSSFRQIDPAIPPDAVIAMRIAELAGIQNPTPTATFTSRPTETPTQTPTPTSTPTTTSTSTPTSTPTTTSTSTATSTPTATSTSTPTSTATDTPSVTGTPTPSPEPSSTPTRTATPFGTPHVCTLATGSQIVLNASKLGFGLTVALTGYQTFDVGPSNANGVRQIQIPATGTHFNCVALPLNSGVLCPRVVADGTGIMDCDGTAGTPDYDTTIQIDHNSNQNSNNPGFDGDTICTNTFTEPGGQVSTALLEDGSAQHPHTGVCNSPVHIVESGTFAAGGMGVTENLVFRFDTSVTTCSPNPCPPDDTPYDPTVGDVQATVSATSGTSALEVFDVNNTTANYTISISGTPFGCANVDANNLSAGKIAAGFPVLDLNSTTGDTIGTVALKCQ